MWLRFLLILIVLIGRFIPRLLILHYSHTRVSMINDYPISCAACDYVETLLELWYARNANVTLIMTYNELLM